MKKRFILEIRYVRRINIMPDLNKWHKWKEYETENAMLTAKRTLERKNKGWMDVRIKS